MRIKKKGTHTHSCRCAPAWHRSSGFDRDARVEAAQARAAKTTATGAHIGAELGKQCSTRGNLQPTRSIKVCNYTFNTHCTLGKMADGVERRGALAEAGAALSAGSSEGVIPTDKYLELFRQLGAFLRSLGSVRCNHKLHICGMYADQNAHSTHIHFAWHRSVAVRVRGSILWRSG
jgi:hypothetical protein